MTAVADHPLVDALGDGWVATEAPAPVVALTPGLSDLLQRAASERRRPIVVTPPHSRMTRPLSEVLADLQGHWVVRTAPGQFYDARSGAELASPSQAIAPPRDAGIATEFLARPIATRMRLVFSVSTRHRVGRPVRLGGVAESLSTSLHDAPPVAWGPTEPVVAPWNRDELTEHSRRRMPADSFWIAVGSAEVPEIATIRVARTAEGIEETTHSASDVGAPGDPRQRTIGETARTGLAAAASHGLPLLGVALAHVSSPDLSHPAHAESVAEPLALLVGPAGAKLLGMEPRDWVDRFGAALLGSPRIPSVLLPLGSTEGGGWERLGDIVGAVPDDRLAKAFAGAPLIAARLRARSASHAREAADA